MKKKTLGQGCPDCFARKAKRVQSTQKWQRQQRAKGLCLLCSNPVVVKQLIYKGVIKETTKQVICWRHRVLSLRQRQWSRK